MQVVKARIVGVGFAACFCLTPAAYAQADAAADPPPEVQAETLIIRNPFQPVPPIAPPPRRPRILPPLYASFALLQIFDGYTTTHGIQAGAAEANRIIEPFAGRPAAVWALKAGVTVGAVLAGEQLWRRRHRVQAIAIMVASNAVLSVVAVHNASVIRDTR